MLEALEAHHGYSERSLDAPMAPEDEAEHQQIVRLRSIDDLTQSQIAERFGISQMQDRQGRSTRGM